MSIIREKIRLMPGIGTGFTTNIKFGLSTNDGFSGLQQEIDNLTQNTSDDLINSPIDVEVRKIAYELTSGPLKLQFNFHVGSANSFGTLFENAGFTINEITMKSSNILNSFFIMDFYDSYDINNQVKIFTTYLTKITAGTTGTVEPISEYSLGSSPNQLYYWYVPVAYLTGSTINGYVKFSFYNAKTGRVQPFYNYDNESLISSQKLFFNATINVNNKTWNIYTPATHAKVVIARELWNSPEYTEKVDKSIVSMKNESQNYPSGNSFDYVTGKYKTI